MADGLIATEANTLLSTLLATFPWIQLHTGLPGAAGTSNVATNSTRVQATWNSPSGGAGTNSNDLVWSSVPADEDYTHFTAWTASTAGSCGFSGIVTAPAVVTTDTFKILAGSLSVSFTLAS